VQDAAHESLLKSRRQQLHARIAEAIDQHDPEAASAQPQLLAQHYAEAGFAERSARAWLAAGRLAASRSASAEAAIQFARGIDVLQSMETGAERDRLELDLQIGLLGRLWAPGGRGRKGVGARHRPVACPPGGPAELLGSARPVYGIFGAG